MSKPQFVYVTYIETSIDRLWQALTDGDFTERYWFGYRIASDWKPGSPYRFTKQGADDKEGKIIAADPPRHLAYTWNACSPEAKREGISRVTFDLVPHGKVVKLTVAHDELDEHGETIRDISIGWPIVLAGLKSLLETGRQLEIAPPSLAREPAGV